MLNPIKKYLAWENRVNSLYAKQGYVLDTDLGLPAWFTRLIFWFSQKTDSKGFKKMSTVVNYDGKVICFHDSSNLLGHANYPNAHVENRYTLDEEFFRSKIWPNNA